MSFLFPLYLLGAAAIAIPLLLHLRRKPPQEVVPFSALMFLDAVPPPPVKRRKLDDLLLLLLRCLAVLLLAFLFSRPLWSATEEKKESGHAWVILLDRSASMQREDVARQVSEKLNVALESIQEEDEVALAVFDRQASITVSFDEWQAQPQGQRKAWLRARVATVESGWGATDLGQALIHAAGLLDAQVSSGEEGSGAQKRSIAVISDFQEGSSLEALGTYAWPQDVQVVSIPVESTGMSNLTLSPAAAHDETGLSGATPKDGEPQPRFRVTSSPGSEPMEYRLAWQGAPEPVLSGQMQPGSSRVFSMPLPANSTAELVLELKGDKVGFDNKAWYARPAMLPAPILILSDKNDAADPNQPLYFLSKALQPGAGILPQITVKSPAELKQEDVSKAGLVVVTGPLEGRASALLQDWVHNGGQVFWTLAQGDQAGSLAAVARMQDLQATEGTGRYAMLTNLCFDLPLLEPFRDASTRDFTKIRFWKHRILKTSEQEQERVTVVARFDDGSPALLEITHGKGRITVLASGLTAGESQLVVSSKFVPLVRSVLAQAGLMPTPQTTLLVGDPIPRSAQAADGEGEVFRDTHAPGLYVFGKGEQSRAYAVNLSPEEGKIVPMDMERLREYGVRFLADDTSPEAVASVDALGQTPADDTRLEAGQKLWKIAALVLLALLLLETLIAAWRESPARSPQPQAT